MNIEQERAAFEAWFTKTKAYISDSKDILAQIVRDIAWDTWKARAALQSQDLEDAESHQRARRRPTPCREYLRLTAQT